MPAIAESPSASRPPTPTGPHPIFHKHRGPSEGLRLTTTGTRKSSESSYIEIFSTPSGSPIESEFTPINSNPTNGREDSLSTLVSGTPPPPSTPLNQFSPDLFYTPSTAKLLSPPPSALPLPSPLSAASEESRTPISASTTKAQCMCPLTVPSTAFPEPQAEWAIPTKDQLAFAASLPIYQSDGTPIEFGSLFAEHRAVVLFLRHFFCPLCQDYVSSLAKLVMSSHLAGSPTSTSPEIPSNDKLVPPLVRRDGQGVSMPPPAAPALAHALRSLGSFDHTVAFRDRLPGPVYDSPYARSTASTAPGSPRM